MTSTLSPVSLPRSVQWAAALPALGGALALLLSWSARAASRVRAGA